MIDARVNLGLVDKALLALRKPDLRPAWKEARQPLRRDIADHRKQQKGPDGVWPRLATSTQERRLGKRRARKLLGKLPTALQTISDRSRVAMRSRVAWSGVHQDGGRAGRSSIPARPFLWASELAVDAVAAIVARHLGKLWGR